MDPKKLAYTYEQAAEAVGVSSRTLRRFVERGDLAAKYINSKPVILASELEAWLESLPSEPGES
ncbi:helix-turn-helix domain-containing protein [Sinomonas gamaensis]|uniref:helix-turn-helix domain-containing protein n=1 Tax=Sinomonas gamaensis TaxID=2565624 RepID=UPI0011091E81|nr:helix-turn-helix domain-containing protein [Sinomonas gamaensis]